MFEVDGSCWFAFMLSGLLRRLWITTEDWSGCKCLNSIDCSHPWGTWFSFEP